MANNTTALAEQAKAQANLIVNNSFIDGLSAQLQEKAKYGLSFPKDYNPTNELMGAYLVLKETVDKNGKPVLESCTQTSIANSLMDMVTLGVSMQKKQCYPVAYGGKLQCQISVYGNTCIARRYGLNKIAAMVIYEGDEFVYHIEDGEIVIDKHTQDFMNIDTDKIKGAYAVATMNDGDKHVELMNIAMIKKAWAQGFGYKEGGNGTHQKFSDQMAMKTVKNRCLKYIIRTYGTEAVTEIIDDIEDHEGDDRVLINTKHDIAVNANTVDFDAEEATPVVEAEVVETKKPVDYEVPEFMNAE